MVQGLRACRQRNSDFRKQSRSYHGSDERSGRSCLAHRRRLLHVPSEHGDNRRKCMWRSSAPHQYKSSKSNLSGMFIAFEFVGSAATTLETLEPSERKIHVRRINYKFRSQRLSSRATGNLICVYFISSTRLETLERTKRKINTVELQWLEN